MTRVVLLLWKYLWGEGNQTNFDLSAQPVKKEKKRDFIDIKP